MLPLFISCSQKDRGRCDTFHTRPVSIGKDLTHWLVLMFFFVMPSGQAQSGHPEPPPPPPGAKTRKCSGRPVPQFTDITAQAGIDFKHTSDPEKKYIIESMSGGVLLFDYDRDGWPDIYFTNAPTASMAVEKKGSPGALYHNNHDGTFSEITPTSGLSNSCFAMGG